MAKKTLLASLFLVFSILIGSVVYAGTFGSFDSFSEFDVSIDRVVVNNQAVSQSNNNLINDADIFVVAVDSTAVKQLSKGHVEISLRGRQSGNVVADSTGTFDALQGASFRSLLTLVLTDGLKKENDYELTVKIADAKGNSRQKAYGIRTKETTAANALDLSIDRVKMNGKVVAASTSNFIDESDNFDVNVDLTANEALKNAHMEAILKDLNSGNAVADATSNFNLGSNSNVLKSLKLQLLDKLTKSGTFELVVRVIDSNGNSAQKSYGIRMHSSGSVFENQKLDVSFDSVEMENKALAEDESNFLSISGSTKDLQLRVKFTALENLKGARIDAVLRFENGDVIADATSTFDISKDAQTVKTLNLPLISKFEQGNFNLDVKITDSDGNSVQKSYGLRILQQKFPFVISSIVLSPESNIQAGKFVTATLRFKNLGILPLEGVTAKVSILELGVSSTKFMDQIKSSGQEQVKEDFTLKIPDGTQAGDYTVRAEISSPLNSNTEAKEIPFVVSAQTAQTDLSDRLLITVPISSQNFKNDGSEAKYPITLTNNGAQARTYTIMLDGSGWADLRLSGANTFVLDPKESKTVNVYASTSSKVLGEQSFFVNVESNGNALKQIELAGNVIGTTSYFAVSLMLLLEIFLILAVIGLAATGLFFGLRNFMPKNKSVQEETAAEEISREIPNELNGEAYY